MRQECRSLLMCNNAQLCQNGDPSSISCQKICDGCPQDAFVLNKEFFKPKGEC